ncbi:hypothetical protein KUW19_00860 [Ferrimonas balearica]|uniref:hypothetical protein n=1 Tax=Ferrimonas balearica TaxID=44012 RepID=UPI001C9776AF|nr:hypothetical protein [Ferrimonas balearica]MBY6105027.1 hypothetical protein [Ferrimonas balearica]
MALPESPNPISLSQIQTEFGGSNPIGLTEYYGKASGIPASGTISMSQFHGKQNGPDWPTVDISLVQWADNIMNVSVFLILLADGTWEGHHWATSGKDNYWVKYKEGSFIPAGASPEDYMIKFVINDENGLGTHDPGFPVKGSFAAFADVAGETVRSISEGRYFIGDVFMKHIPTGLEQNVGTWQIGKKT